MRRSNPARESSHTPTDPLALRIPRTSRGFFIHTGTSDTKFNLRAGQHACFTLTPVVACPRAFARSLQTFNAVRLLQLVVPTSTRFTAPLLTRSDSRREKSLASRSSLRLTAHMHDKGRYHSCPIERPVRVEATFAAIAARWPKWAKRSLSL